MQSSNCQVSLIGQPRNVYLGTSNDDHASSCINQTLEYLYAVRKKNKTSVVNIMARRWVIQLWLQYIFGQKCKLIFNNRNCSIYIRYNVCVWKRSRPRNKDLTDFLWNGLFYNEVYICYSRVWKYLKITIKIVQC